jgi:MFS family permease
VIIPAIIMLFLSGAYASINGFIVIYAGISNVSSIGLFFTVYAISVLLSRPFSGRIADKYGLDKMLIPGMLIFALSFIIISFSHSLPMFLLSGVISAFGYGICQPLMQTLSLRLVSNERRGVAGNTTYIGVDTGNLVTPVLAGTIVTSVQNITGNSLFGYEVMYRVMIIPVLIALVLFILKRKALHIKTETRNQRDIELEVTETETANMDRK